MGALDALIFGYRHFFSDTTEIAQRKKASFGPEFSLADDEVNEWTRISVTPSGVQGDVDGIFTSTAKLTIWQPSSTVRGMTAGAAGATNADGQTAIVPDFGGLSFTSFPRIYQVSAIVSGRKSAGNWAVFRISRNFVRHSAGNIVADDTTHDDGSYQFGTAAGWDAPQVGWSNDDNIPLVIVDQNADTGTVQWRAIVAMAEFSG